MVIVDDYWSNKVQLIFLVKQTIMKPKIKSPCQSECPSEAPQSHQPELEIISAVCPKYVQETKLNENMVKSIFNIELEMKNSQW